jgi:hypothetical protein
MHPLLATGVYPLPTGLAQLAAGLRELALLEHTCSAEELRVLSAVRHAALRCAAVELCCMAPRGGLSSELCCTALRFSGCGFACAPCGTRSLHVLILHVVVF